MDTKRPMKSVLIYLFIALVATLIAVVGFEIHVRMQIAEKLDQHFAAMPLWLQNQTLGPSDIDKIVGRPVRMAPNALFKIDTKFDFGAEVNGRAVLDFSVRTNNLGLLTDLPVAIERRSEDREFRILVFGDSLTGTVTANYQWVDTIEQLLNARDELRRAVGGRRLRVINMGWVAAGFAHFWEAYERVGAQLKADLLVVNFTYDDFPRRHKGPRFSDPADMVTQAAEAVNNFRNTGIPVIVTQMPLYAEIVPEQIKFPLTTQLEQRIGGIRVVDMRDHLPLRFGPSAIRYWYNLPYDHHMSDYGGELYARAMANVIARHVGVQGHDFMRDQSTYFDPRRCLQTVQELAVGAMPDAVFDFSTMPDTPLEIREASVSIPNGWTFIATGTGGQGLAHVVKTVGDPATITFEQIQPSRSGTPSLMRLLGRAAFLHGQTVAVRFRAKATGTSGFALMLVRYDGTGVKGRGAETLIEQVAFGLSDTWRDLDIRVSIPSLDPSLVGENGDDHLRLQILPSEPGSVFKLELSPIQIYNLGAATKSAVPPGCAVRPREETEVRRILGSPERIKRLRDKVRNRLGQARVSSWRPLVFDIVQGLDPLIPPLTRQMRGGFIEVPFGDAPNERAFLNVFCTSGEISLDNSACYTNQHFFVK